MEIAESVLRFEGGRNEFGGLGGDLGRNTYSGSRCCISKRLNVQASRLETGDEMEMEKC